MTSKKPMLPKLTLSVAVVAAALVSLAACLQPSGGATTGGVGTDASVDSGTDSAVDSGKDIAVDTIEPWCFGVFCDDGNECTIDSCDETNGQCIYDPVADGTDCDECGYCSAGQCLVTITHAAAEPPECSIDSECDDGNPCTIDSCQCQVTTGPCGSPVGSWCWCEHKPSPIALGCGPVTQPVCNGVGAISAGDALTSPAGSFVKVAGSADMAPYEVCNDNLCGDCLGELALSDTSGNKLLLEPGSETPMVWSCATSQCGVAKSCGPMAADVAYWAWGTLEDYDPFGNAISNRKLVVEGWCLQSPVPTFAGVYYGTFQPYIGGGFEVGMTLGQDSDGTWQLSLSEMGEHPAQPGYNVVVGEGSLVFEVFVPDSITGWSQVVLQVDGNNLVGDYSIASKPVDAAPLPFVPVGGMVHLTRQGDL